MFAHESKADHPSPTSCTLYPDISLKLSLFLNLPVLKQAVNRTHPDIKLVVFTGTDDDLEFYVRKCGEILGVTSKLDKEQRDAKHILEHIFFQVVEFKKLNQVSVFITTSSCI